MTWEPGDKILMDGGRVQTVAGDVGGRWYPLRTLVLVNAVLLVLTAAVCSWAGYMGGQAEVPMCRLCELHECHDGGVTVRGQPVDQSHVTPDGYCMDQEGSAACVPERSVDPTTVAP